MGARIPYIRPIHRATWLALGGCMNPDLFRRQVRRRWRYFQAVY